MSRIQIDLSGFQGSIFDMDGTMINNMNYHMQAWQAFLKRYGITLTESEFKTKFSGKKNHEIFTILFGAELSDDEIQKLADEKEAVYRELYSPHITEVAGLANTIQFLHQHNIKTAIATTALAANCDFVLKQLDLSDKFEVILGDEHITHGKPDPEIYLAAADQLGLDPATCLVFEDTPPGVAAGKAAGMTVVGLTTTHTTADLGQADYIAKDFDEIEFV